MQQNIDIRANLETTRRNLRANSVNIADNNRQLATASALKICSDALLATLAAELDCARKTLQEKETALEEAYQAAGVRTHEDLQKVEELLKNVTTLTTGVLTGLSQLRVLLSSIDHDDPRFSLVSALKIIAFTDGVLSSSGAIESNDRHTLALECGMAVDY